MCSSDLWRADYYQEIFNKNAIKNVLKLLHKHLPGKSILFTYRTAAEGGEGITESDKYGALCRKAIDSGYIDIIDIEYSMGWHTVRHITTYAKQRGVAVISSSHDFEKTPLEDELRNRLSEMRKSGADIVKIAVMPRIPQEVLRIQSVAVEFSDSDNAVPVVAISMGKMGMASRITGEI